MKEGESIESRMVTRRIEAAQKKVEERHFEGRKHLLEYDEVMDQQRKNVYGYRQKILEGANCRELILDAVRRQIEHHIGMYLDRDFGLDTFAEWAGKRLATNLEARDFRGMDFQQAENYARSEAERYAETQVFDAIEENLPENAGPADDEADEPAAEWNWLALTKFANTRWGLNLRDRDLKRLGRNEVAEMLLEKAREAIGRVDLSDGQAFLREDFGRRSAILWVRNKYGIELDFEEVRELEPAEVQRLVCQRAERTYDEKEAEYPVMAALYQFASGPGHSRLDREALIAWAQERFQVSIDLDDLKHKQREEIRSLLVEHSLAYQQRGRKLFEELSARIQQLFEAAPVERAAGRRTAGQDSLAALAAWVAEVTRFPVGADGLETLETEALRWKLGEVIEERYRPEMRRMERQILLHIVDGAWKDHLLAMDHLRSSIGLMGYAQVDPKVEYKREGMKLFENMWKSVGERVSELIFRIEQLDEGFVGSTWVETSATHAQAQSAGEIAREQQEAIEASKGPAVVETIRNRGPKVGRNDPCPCGSGKKYKNCCMRKTGVA